MPGNHDAVEDGQELFRRMVFNIRVGNVDDHLRNHGFFLTRNEAQQIVGEVDEAVSHWRTEFRLAGLSSSEVHMLEPVFAAYVESDAMCGSVCQC